MDSESLGKVIIIHMLGRADLDGTGIVDQDVDSF